MGSIPIITKIEQVIINPIITILFAIAFMVFVYGMVEFISNSASSGKREQGIQHMLYGFLGFFVMVSAKGIIALICTTIGCQG